MAENLNSVTLSKAQIEVIHSKINLLLDNPNVSPEELVDAMDDSNEPKEKGTKAHKIMGSAMYGNNKYMKKILNDISSKTENQFVDDNMYFIEEAEKVVMNSYSPTTTTSTSSSFITPLHKDANDIYPML